MLSLFAFLRQLAEPTPFLPPFFPPPEISSCCETLTAITLFGTQKVLTIPVGRKYSIRSSPLTSFSSMILTYLLFSIALLAVAPSLLSPLLLPLSLSLVLWRCFRTWVLITNQFNKLSLFSNLSPQQTSSFFNFQKACWNDFAFYFDSHCPSAKEYSFLSLSSAAALFTSLAQNAAKSLIPFGRIKGNLKPGGPVKWKKRLVKNALAAAHRKW